MDGLFTTNITQIQRAAFQPALAGSYYPEFFNRVSGRSLHVDVSFGARLGGASSSYSQPTTPALESWRTIYLEKGLDPGHLPVPGNGTQSGFLVGLVTSIGLGASWHDVSIGRWTGDIGLGVGVELVQDWIDLGNLSTSSHGLGVVTPLLSVSVGF